jgi:cell division protein FtsL
MLRLGILLVVLVVATAVMVVIRNEIVRPALKRRRLAQLEEENRRLDALIETRDKQEAPR